MPEASKLSRTKSARCRLLIALMDRACRLSRLSRRQLAWQLGVSAGTVNAYYLGRVDPLHSRLIIQRRLAKLNGLHLEELLAFYDSGDWGAIPDRAVQLVRDLLPDLRVGKRLSAWSDPGLGHAAEGWSCATSMAGH